MENIDITSIERLEIDPNLRSPPPLLVIENICGNVVIVTRTKIFFHPSPGEKEIAPIDIDDSKYRGLVFIGCKECDIQILDKFLKLSCISCGASTITVFGGIIGIVEIYKCQDMTLNIQTSTPIVQIDNCTSIRCNQCVDEVFYAVCLSDNIVAYIMDKKYRIEKECKLQTGMFGEQLVVLFSRNQEISTHYNYHKPRDVNLNIIGTVNN